MFRVSPRQRRTTRLHNYCLDFPPRTTPGLLSGSPHAPGHRNISQHSWRVTRDHGAWLERLQKKQRERWPVPEHWKHQRAPAHVRLTVHQILACREGGREVYFARRNRCVYALCNSLSWASSLSLSLIYMLLPSGQSLGLRMGLKRSLV